MTNLSLPTDRQSLSQKLKLDIEEATKLHFTDSPRKHLGASIIGHECSAYLWNVFRWLKQEDFSGRMLRLFNRGHLEEARFIKWLTLIGFTCYEINPETGNQFQISGVNGHFGGSLDGVVFRADLGSLLSEFKTHGEKSFVKLQAEGVRKSKPQHYKQMCTYGKAFGIQYGLYAAVNKNTDELHIEIVELDWSLADDLFRKADSIIHSQTQPQKIAQNETYFTCKYCHFSGICFRGEAPAKNCRSCANATPTENATWTCGLYGLIPGEEAIAAGCSSWKRII
jgi:hypothetical protein